MRLDKFLKVSRIIKRRTVANDACDNAHVTVNGRPAKASYDVKENDIIEITFGTRTLKICVLDVMLQEVGFQLCPRRAAFTEVFLNALHILTVYKQQMFCVRHYAKKANFDCN